MTHHAGPYCKSCGYSLQGLAAGKCPECARAFDPADASTVDTTPRRTRRARRLRLLLLLVGVIALIIATFPRGYAQGLITIPDPAGALRIERTQLIPPAWFTRIGGRYPGWTRRTILPALPPVPIQFFAAQEYGLTAHGWVGMGSCTASATQTSLPTMTINGIPVTSERAEDVFATVLPNIAAGRSYGIQLGSTAPATPVTLPAPGPGNP